MRIAKAVFKNWNEVFSKSWYQETERRASLETDSCFFTPPPLQSLSRQPASQPLNFSATQGQMGGGRTHILQAWVPLCPQPLRPYKRP